MCICVRYGESLNLENASKVEKDGFLQMLREIKSQEVLILKKWSDDKLSLLFWVWEATPVQCTLDKKHQRGCCISSASDSTFMHLYYKKCASTSKLTVLSKVLQLQLGICISGLALFTGWWVFWGGICFSPGVPVGCFLWGVVMKEGVFVSSILDFGE